MAESIRGSETVAISINIVPFQLVPEDIAFDENLQSLNPLVQELLDIVNQLRNALGGSAGAIQITEGGTGANDASTARVNLGLEIGVDIQAWDADLDAIAALSPSTDDLIIRSGGTWVVISEAAFKTLYDLEIGVDIQAYSANLDEADTFFSLTDITGAEAETLTDTSNADTLHSHSHNNTTSLQGGTTAEYYHLTNSEHSEITTFFSSTDITGAQAETLTDGSDADALHSHETYKTLTNEIRTYLLGDRLFSGNPDLAIDTNFDVQTQNSVTVSIDGDLYTVSSSTCDTGSVSFPAGTWGIMLVSSDSAGNLTGTWDTNGGSGYGSEPTTLPSLPSNEAPIGYITVQADASNSFTAGTDALQGGTGGNPAQTTNYYNKADPMGVIGSAI